MIRQASAAFFLVFILALPCGAKILFTLVGQVNINKAGAENLMKLPFIGEKRAKSIIAHRKKFGLFNTPDEITAINGISIDTFSAIKEYLSVRGKTDLRFSPQTGSGGPIVAPQSFDGPIRALDNDKYFSALKKKIKEAKESILLSLYLFKTSKFKNNRANSVLRDLLSASGRGVKVTAVFEQNDYGGKSINQSNQHTAEKLRKGGVQVFFDGKNRITHTKLIIIDETFLFIGSHNLTHTALKKSNEASLMIKSPKLSRYFKLYIENILPHPL